MLEFIDRKAAFEAKTMPYIDSLFRTAAWMLSDKDDAEDLVRQTYVRAYNFWDKFHKIADCRTYLFKTMINIFAKKFQAEPALQTWTNSDKVAGHNHWNQLQNREILFDPVEATISKINSADVRKILMDLPDDFKLVIVLSWLEGFSYREIGLIAGIRLEIVKSRQYEGCQLLKEKIYEHSIVENQPISVI